MNKKSERYFFLFLILFVILLISIGIAYYLKVNSEKTLFLSVNSKGHSPFNISKTDILVSFKIDDITFSKDQEPILEDALFLARKYNVTFDLGVIAEPFNENADQETFKLYQDNQNVFEVVSHGLTHTLDPSLYISSNVSYGDYGEFYIVSESDKSVPVNIQEHHIARMKEIFENNNLTMATKIFVVPYHKGNENTIILAEKYGYKLIVEQLTNPKTYLEENYKNITATENYIDIPTHNEFVLEDIKNYSTELNKAISLNQTRIDISLHPINFQYLENADYLMKGMTEIQKFNSKIKFGMISDRFYIT